MLAEKPKKFGETVKGLYARIGPGFDRLFAKADSASKKWDARLAPWAEDMTLGRGLLIFAVVAALLIVLWLASPKFATCFATIIGGGLLLWQIFAFSRRAAAAEKTADLTEKGNIAERFKTAIEQLGSASATIRLGGIYALHHIAATTKDYAETENYRERVFEMLCAYVRETTTAAGYQPREDRGGRTVLERKPDFAVRPYIFDSVVEKVRVTPTLEIQTILDLLFRKGASVYAGLVADLTDANLEGANLHKAQLPSAVLNGVVLTHSVLNEANLQKAQLSDADFQDAILRMADLRNAFLGYANLCGINAWDANFEAADLQNADLHGANLGCNLKNAELYGANLSFASSPGVENLTIYQLSRTCSLYESGDALGFPDDVNVAIGKLRMLKPELFGVQSVDEFYHRRNPDKGREDDEG